MSNSHRLGQQFTCLNPNCGYEFDAATDANGNAVATPGAVAICFKCAHFHIFTSSGDDGQIDGIVECDADTKAEILSNPYNHALIDMVLNRGRDADRS